MARIEELNDRSNGMWRIIGRLSPQQHSAEPRKFDFVDALRGWAILAVILVHAGGAVTAASSWLLTLMSAGARGVQLFYVASAFTLCLSWESRAGHERRPLRNFYLRRIFRIVPMFYVAIAAYVLLYGLEPRYYAPDGVRWFYVPLTAMFLNGFHPATITSVVPGGWSIVVEMTFYLVLPLLVTRCRSLGSLGLLLAASIAAAFVWVRVVYALYLHTYPPDQSYLVDTLAVLGFPSQFPVFVMGMLVFWCYRRPDYWKTAVTIGVILAAAWIATRLPFTLTSVTETLAMHLPIGALLALFALVITRYPLPLVVNPLVTWMGTLSFSMYLTHFAVIDAFKAIGLSQRFGSGNVPAILHYALVVAATAGVSALCYRLIERPGIEAGRRLIDRLESA